METIISRFYHIISMIAASSAIHLVHCCHDQMSLIAVSYPIIFIHDMTDTLGESAVSYGIVKRWFRTFKMWKNVLWRWTWRWPSKNCQQLQKTSTKCMIYYCKIDESQSETYYNTKTSVRSEGMWPSNSIHSNLPFTPFSIHVNDRSPLIKP